MRKNGSTEVKLQHDTITLWAEVMNLHLESEKIQQAGIHAMYKLAQNCPQNKDREKLVAFCFGPVQVCMMKHPTSSGVNESCCALLCFLSDMGNFVDALKNHPDLLRQVAATSKKFIGSLPLITKSFTMFNNILDSPKGIAIFKANRALIQEVRSLGLDQTNVNRKLATVGQVMTLIKNL